MPLEQDKLGGFKLSLSEELRTGIYADQYSNRIPLWEMGENVRVTDVGISKAGSYEVRIATTEQSPIRGVLQFAEDDQFIAYFGDLTKLYRGNMGAGTYEVLGSGYQLLNDAGAAAWDGGASIWDGGETLWDFGFSDAEHWSIINYGKFILATSGAVADTPQIKKTNGAFCSMRGGVVGLTLTNGGSGYEPGDTIAFTGGDGSGATAEVESVTLGVVTSVKMTNGGSGYTVAPTGFTTSGSGTGLDITPQLCNIDVDRVKIFLQRGPHVLGFNTSNSPREVIWSAADDVDDWVAASDNLAGALEIREMKSGILAAVPLGNRTAMYGDDQMFLLNYLGNDLVFGYQPALNGIGSVSPRSVVVVANFNYGLSTQGFFRTDGATVEWIDRGKVRYWFRSRVNTAQISKCVAYHDEQSRQVRWSFPTDSVSPEMSVVYNYEFDEWSFYSEGMSAAEERTVAPFPVTGDERGQIRWEGSGNNAHTSPLPSFIRTKAMDLGSPDSVKELSSIRVGYRGEGLQYRIGWSETENGTINWGTYQNVNAGYEFHNLRTAGRYLYIELYSGGINVDWELMNIEIQGRAEGTR